jgi:predicted alpha/beta-hydrolase family hydrolase
MNLILLPGKSARNQEWLLDVEAALELSFDKTARVSYSHWTREEADPAIDLELEAQKLGKVADSMEPYAIFAKSAGTMVTAKAISEGLIKPKWCLFAGLPIFMISEYKLPADQWIANMDMPATLVQNERDPYGNYDKVSQYVHQLNSHIRLVSVEGRVTHSYEDYDVLAREVSVLQAKQ